MHNSYTISYCPCSNQRFYEDCCQPYHFGASIAPSPEALMRSRFTAFMLKLPDYLRESWHASTRPTALNLDDSPDWASLRILGSGETGNAGWVHFQAIHRLGSGWGYLQEKSEFVREDGRWFYLRGQPEEGILKPGRNDPCPCGSSRKYKACCL